jgi:hypothetical protein
MALGRASSIDEYMQAARLVTLAEVDLIRCGGYCARAKAIGFAMDGASPRANA